MSLASQIGLLATRIAQEIKKRGMPTGGTAGQVLAKTAGTDFAAGWTTSAASPPTTVYPASGVTFYATGWADNVGSTKITKDASGTVTVVLAAFKSSIVAAGDVLGTLPTGARPQQSVRRVATAYSQSGGDFIGTINVLVNTDGTIVAGRFTTDQPRSVHTDLSFTTL